MSTMIPKNTDESTAKWFKGIAVARVKRPPGSARMQCNRVAMQFKVGAAWHMGLQVRSTNDEREVGAHLCKS